MKNKALKYAFLVSLKIQVERDTKKSLPNHEYGKFKKMTFECSSVTDVKHTMYFENHNSGIQLTEQGIKDFEKKLNVNLSKEFAGENLTKKQCKNIFAIIDCENKKMAVCWEYVDGTFNDLNI